MPASRFGNRQIIGIAELDQADSPDLVEKTNREGLQENQAYRDLRDLVLGAVAQLEQLSLEKRRQVTATGRKTKRQELETTIEDLKQQIREIKENAREDGLADQVAGAAIPSDCVAVPKDRLADLEERATYISESMKDVIDAQEDERETYLHLLGIGLAAERFTHEFDRLVGLSSDLVQKLGRTGSLSKAECQQLDVFINTLRNEIRLMGVLRYVRRSQPVSDVSVGKLIELVLRAREHDIESNSIRKELVGTPDFAVRMPEASVAQVLDNIIDNGIYWLKQKAEKGDRRIKIEVDAAKRAVFISNNGPAVQPNVKRNLFTMPFTTSKPEGRGLGMYISAAILKQYGAGIRLVSFEQDPRVLPGGAFSIDFGPESQPKRG